MQKFHYGDHIKIADDYSSAFKAEPGEDFKPILSQWAGKEAIVIEGGSGDCSLYIKNQGEVAWFPARSLILIKKNALELLKKWKEEMRLEIEQKSDLDWIFANGEKVINYGFGASMEALAKCFGVDNLWGNHGEGFEYFENASLTLYIAKPFLEKRDKEGWLKFCETIRKIK